MKERGSPHFGTGIVSLIVIFSVLCMAVLALLSWQTARNQQILAQRAGVAAQEYYTADAAAQKARALVQNGEAGNMSGVSVELEGSAKDNAQIDVTWNEDEATYSVPVSEVLRLEITLRVADGQSTALRWATVATTDWEADETIEVWSGT